MSSIVYRITLKTVKLGEHRSYIPAIQGLKRRKMPIGQELYFDVITYQYGLGSKDNESHWNQNSIAQCTRYTILTILVCIIPDSSSNRL